MHPKKLKTTRFPQVLQHWSEAISQISNTCAFMSVHWLVLYCLYSFPDSNYHGRFLSLAHCLAGGKAKQRRKQPRHRSHWSGQNCYLYSVINLGRSGWYEREVGSTSVPFQPPLLKSTSPPCSAPRSSQGWLGQPWGENMLQSRQTIFRLTAFTFVPSRASWKQTDKTKDSKLMTRAPHHPHLPPTTLASIPDDWLLAWHVLSFPPSLPPSSPSSSRLLVLTKSCMHDTHISGYRDTGNAHARACTSLPPSPSFLTPWPIASGLNCHRKRETETYRGKEWVRVRERKGLSVCVWTFIIMC